WLPSLVATLCGTLIVLAFSQRHAAQRPIAIAATASAMDRYECVTSLPSSCALPLGHLLVRRAPRDDNRFRCRGVHLKGFRGRVPPGPPTAQRHVQNNLLNRAYRLPDKTIDTG